MKKNILINLLIIVIPLILYSQNIKEPVTAIFCYDKKTDTFYKRDPKLTKIKEEGKLIALQVQLKNLNYDIDITNCIDLKTTKAFELEKNKLFRQKAKEKKEIQLKRKEKRKIERLKRKKNRKKRKK